MYQAKSGVKKFSLYWWGGSLNKIVFPSLNMYQAKSGVKNFSLYWGGGGSLNKKFFFRSEHVSSQIWCQKFFPLLRLGTPHQTWDRVPPLDLDLGPPHLDLVPPSYLYLDLGPPYLDLGPPLPGPGPGTPPPPKCGQTENITFRHPSDAGGNKTILKEIANIRFPQNCSTSTTK